MATILNPYLQFKDSAADALAFYAGVFGGQATVMTFGQMGIEGDEANKVMHGQLLTDAGYTIMASDTPEQMEYTPGGNVSLSLSGNDVEALRSYFAGLSEGAEVLQPLAEQAWGDEFGMLTDKFGIRWLVNIATSSARDEA